MPLWMGDGRCLLQVTPSSRTKKEKEPPSQSPRQAHLYPTPLWDKLRAPRLELLSCLDAVTLTARRGRRDLGGGRWPIRCLLQPGKLLASLISSLYPKQGGSFLVCLVQALVLVCLGLWENENLPLQIQVTFFVPLRMQSSWNTTTRKRKPFCLVPFCPLVPQAESLLRLGWGWGSVRGGREAKEEKRSLGQKKKGVNKSTVLSAAQT